MQIKKSFKKAMSLGLVFGFTFVFSFGVNNTVLAEDLLILKSGDKMLGSLIKIDKNNATFKFKNNTLNFKVIDIDSISFNYKNKIIDEKKESKKAFGLIKGVVTYSEKKDKDNSPDIGTKVYFLNKKYLSNFNTSIMENYYVQANISSLSKDNENEFEKTFQEGLKEVEKITDNKNVIMTTVDNNGNYSQKLEEGIYYILISSNNVKDSFGGKILGRTYYNDFRIKKDEESNQSTKFFRFFF